MSGVSIPNLQIVIVADHVVGHLLRRGVAGIEAFDRDDRSVGLYQTADEAARARALGWQP
jgi:hypothetical protein